MNINHTDALDESSVVQSDWQENQQEKADDSWLEREVSRMEPPKERCQGYGSVSQMEREARAKESAEERGYWGWEPISKLYEYDDNA